MKIKSSLPVFAGVSCASLFLPVNAVSQATDPSGPLGSGTQQLTLPDLEDPEDAGGFNLPDLNTVLPTPSTRADAQFVAVSDITINGVEAAEMIGPISLIEFDTEAMIQSNGGQISRSQIVSARDQITRAYIEAGYINSGAVLEDQDLSDGELTIKVIEGRLSDVLTRIDSKPLFGNSRSTAQLEEESGAVEAGWRPFRLREAFVKDRIWPNSNKTLNQIELQKNFQNLASEPAIETIDAALLPGVEPGKARLLLDVQETSPVWFNVSAASDRAPSIGGERIYATGGVRNLLGYGDTLGFQVGVTEGLTDGSISYNLPIGTSRFSINAHAEASDAEIVEEPLTNLNVLSSSSSYGVGGAVKILDGTRMQCRDGGSVAQCANGSVSSSLYDLSLSIDVSQKRTESELLGIPFSFSPGAVDGETENTVLNASLDGVLQSPRQVAAARVSVSYGLEALDTPALGAPPANFISILGQAQYARRVFDNLDHQIITRLDVQYSADTLFTNQRYAFGGIDSVRGYRKNDVLADNAVVGSIEYRVGLAPVFKNSQSRFFDNWSVGVFAEGGHGWNSELADPAIDTLASAGVQLNFEVGRRVSGSVYYGHQIEQIPSRQDELFQDSGIGFRVSVRGF